MNKYPHLTDSEMANIKRLITTRNYNTIDNHHVRLGTANEKIYEWWIIVDHGYSTVIFETIDKELYDLKDVEGHEYVEEILANV